MNPMLTNKKWSGTNWMTYDWESVQDPAITIDDFIQTKFQEQGYLTMLISPNGEGCTAFPTNMKPKSMFDFVMPALSSFVSCSSKCHKNMRKKQFKFFFFCFYNIVYFWNGIFSR